MTRGFITLTNLHQWLIVEASHCYTWASKVNFQGIIPLLPERAVC